MTDPDVLAGTVAYAVAAELRKLAEEYRTAWFDHWARYDGYEIAAYLDDAARLWEVGPSLNTSKVF